jgi:hypothetical protein
MSESKPGTPSGLMMKYFVLKPHGTNIYAQASRRAMRAYASLIMPENEAFALELREWADREFEQAVRDGMLDKNEETR